MWRIQNETAQACPGKKQLVKIASKIVFFRSFFFASLIPFLVSLLFERFVLLGNPDRTFSG